jgi:hypothetical protein
VAAAAQVSAAIFTAVMAKRTHELATKTGSMAEASNNMAAAASKEADAVVAQGEVLERQANAMAQLAEEARRDRELAWQPLLALEHLGGETQTGTARRTSFHVRVTNVGNGPALSCSIYANYEGHWGSWNRFPLKPGEQRDRAIHLDSAIAFPAELLAAKPGTQRPPAIRMTQLPPEFVAVCTDALGRRWRFFPGLPGETVAADDLDPPPWVQYLPEPQTPRADHPTSRITGGPPLCA